LIAFCELAIHNALNELHIKFTICINCCLHSLLICNTVIVR